MVLSIFAAGGIRNCSDSSVSVTLDELVEGVECDHHD